MKVELHNSALQRPPVRISLSVPVGVHEALTTLARRSGLRPSEVAREALREYRPLAQEIARLNRANTEVLP